MTLTWQTPFPCQSMYIYNRKTEKHNSPIVYTRKLGSKTYLYYHVTDWALIVKYLSLLIFPLLTPTIKLCFEWDLQVKGPDFPHLRWQELVHTWHARGETQDSGRWKKITKEQRLLCTHDAQFAGIHIYKGEPISALFSSLLLQKPLHEFCASSFTQKRICCANTALPVSRKSVIILVGVRLSFHWAAQLWTLCFQWKANLIQWNKPGL